MSIEHQGVVVNVVDKSKWRVIYPDAPLEHSFGVLTMPADDFSEDSEARRFPSIFGWNCGEDQPLRTATDIIWRDYCIRRGLPQETPYTVRHTGDWADVELDLDKSPRQLQLVKPELWQGDFRVYVWVEFSRVQP